MNAIMHFEIFRAPSFHLTSLLRGGGDWRWRFCSAAGDIVARSDGYRSEKDCLDAVQSLRGGAAQATVRHSAADAKPS